MLLEPDDEELCESFETMDACGIGILYIESVGI